MWVVAQHLRETSAEVWRLWNDIVREAYACTDVRGVVVVLEVDSVETARRHLDALPLTDHGLVEWTYLPVTAPLESLMNLATDADAR